MRPILMPLLVVSLVGCNSTITEDFATTPSEKNWFVCHRPENSFKFGTVDERGRTAMVAVVRPEPKSFRHLEERHGGCQNEDGSYARDGKERAEIWERRRRWLRLGTDVWYRFDMYIDNRLGPMAKRLVAGQWKETTGARDGPVLAQRFTGRRFTISIEQDNHAPLRNPGDNLCRVLVADQFPLSQSPAGWPHSDDDSLTQPGRLAKAALTSPTKRATEATEPGCARGIRARQYNTLPDPFGRWTTMVFHMRLTPEKGLVEIWADGRRISSVTGRIGFTEKQAQALQFFKFGPYRDPENFETSMMFANYVRSTSRTKVDPKGNLTPE